MKTKTMTWNIDEGRTLPLYIAYLQTIDLSIRDIIITKSSTRPFASPGQTLYTAKEAIIICTQNQEVPQWVKDQQEETLPSKLNVEPIKKKKSYTNSIDDLIEDVSNEVYDFQASSDPEKHLIIKGLQGLIRELETTLEPTTQEEPILEKTLHSKNHLQLLKRIIQEFKDQNQREDGNIYFKSNYFKGNPYFTKDEYDALWVYLS